MNRAIIFLLVLLSIHIYFIDNAIGAAQQAPANNNKIGISVPKAFVPEKANYVVVTVTLPEDTSTGDHINFSLLSSAFPGHCNNGFFGDRYGEDPNDEDNQDDKPDMAFIPANLEAPDGATWKNSTSTEQVKAVKLIIGQDANKIPTSVVLKIQCYDYGAVAKLHAEVYNKEDETENTAMIPYDKDGNYIADSWQEGNYSTSQGWAKNDVKWLGGANDDTEQGPGANTHNGDGLTAFAEYRGHLVRLIHTRTHPDEKDVFIYLASGVRTSDSVFGWADNLPDIFTLREVSTSDVRNYNRANTSMNFLVCSDYHRITQRAIRIIIDSVKNDGNNHIGLCLPFDSGSSLGKTSIVLQGPIRWTDDNLIFTDFLVILMMKCQQNLVYSLHL